MNSKRTLFRKLFVRSNVARWFCEQKQAFTLKEFELPNVVEPQPIATNLQFNFNRLWLLSKSETISILESVGESLALKPSDVEESIRQRNEKLKISANNNNDYFNRIGVHPAGNPDVQLLIFDLIIQNCLSMATIQESKNENLKEAIKEKFEQNPNLKIGFAWNERSLPLGALPYPEWESVAKLTPDGSSWVISGSKNRILNQDYDYYIVFCRTTDYPDLERPVYMIDNRDEPNPGVVAVLLRRDQIAKVTDEGVENSVGYKTITFEGVSLPREHYEIFPAEEFGVKAQNAKGFGHVATASFILGQMKSLLNFTYNYLINERKPLLDCEIVQTLLCDMTRKIYALESVVYMVAAMYDCFDRDYGAHLYLEAATCKILAVEYGRDIYQKAQTVFGSKFLTASPFIDFINILDSFLDGSLHNRILVGLQGMKLLGTYTNDHVHKLNLGPFYPMYMIKHAFKKSYYQKRSKLPFSEWDIKGYLHPSLQHEADQLELCLQVLKHSAEFSLLRYTKNISRHQCDINRLTQMAIDIFTLTCVLSRASRAYCDGIRNGDIDVFTAKYISEETTLRNQALLLDLERSEIDKLEKMDEHIHHRNIKFNGYYAFPPLDKTFY
ncbi:Acyl-CoA dehydrogenase-like protein [Dinothrombium tinctorium]|uniref:Acyl-CoA dehydrogenase-like protein n=1 Tax=Dinothrombium tinctorium TaxID=1965070 RepID=A0A3S3NLX4_9ACAR|nr:Acyl-CoA dehydrogenase-like protein [Dinothrombium tinctorium]RWS05286.1 Acyl-CoA dehydrogenase-like protein [Dinothrombium tinctorium]RWS05886.1 Acyl-CoA dehydrogenase-like protein [Dinothrombium tinctorium]